jgi:molybdate transport system substrate-binding protein
VARVRAGGLAAALVSLIAAVLVACSSGVGGTPANGSSAAAPAPVSLTIFGAASLKRVLDELKVVYGSANPATSLAVSVDSSATLETQIEQGAPADVFLSADTANPRRLVDAGLAVGEPVTFATNRLAVIVPTSNPARIRTPADLARPGVKLIAAGDAVPISVYTARLIANLASEPGYPAGYAAACAVNVASKEDNVKAIVARLELGEGDAGIVYATDAKASTKVVMIAVPDAANVAAPYAGVVVRSSAHPAAAAALLAWLAGPGGQAILAGDGFGPPS